MRFPTRGDEFDDGVEIGLAIARMASGETSIPASVGEASVEQLRALARRLNYRVEAEDSDGRLVTLMLAPVSKRPRLRLVGAGQDA